MIYTASRRASHRFAACLLALAAGIACVGCEEQDTTAAAIERAKLALDRISLPATPVEANDAAEAALARIVTDLRPVAGQGTAGQKAAASLLVAQAQLGIGDRRGAFAALAEREAMTSLTPARVAIDRALATASRSSSALAYDPAAFIERLQGEIRSKDAEITQRQRDRAQIEADLMLLRQGAAERLQMAAARRDEAGRMSVRAMALPTDEAARVIADVHRIRREADAIEVDGAQLQARADVRGPELAEQDLLVQQVVSQKAELERALAEARARSTASRAAAAEHAAAAAEAAARIDQILAALLAQRKDVADARVNAAAEAYAAAQGSARAAGNDGAALVGAAAQGQADLMWVRGRNLGSLAEVLEQFAAFPIPVALPAGERAELQGRLDRHRRQAAELREAQREALAKAAELFGEARDGFQRVRGDTEAARARVNRLTQLMHMSRRAASGAAIDLRAITGDPVEFAEDAPSDGDM